MKMNLNEIKTIAKKCKVSETKTDGKKKVAKTKSELIEDVKKVLAKK